MAMKKAPFGSWFGNRSWRRNLARAFAFHPDVISPHELLAVLDAEDAFENETRRRRGRAPSSREARVRGMAVSQDGAWPPERHGPVRGA
jgi:hypothetical protein